MTELNDKGNPVNHQRPVDFDYLGLDSQIYPAGLDDALRGSNIVVPDFQDGTPVRDQFHDPSLLEEETVDEVIRRLAERSLVDYLEEVWPIIEPGRPFYRGWHIDAICEHLEAVSRGEITKLLINVPPRTTKSTLVSVVWPSWEWTTKPGTRWLMSTYGDTLVQRDAIKCRDLVGSQWYQANWGDRVKLKFDQQAVHFYKNMAGGYRVSSTPGGQATGFGGDRIVCDDPHNVKEKESTNEIKKRVEWWSKSMSTRFEDANTAAWVVCGQRICLGDLSDHCIEEGYEHLMIPMDYDPEHPMYERSPKCIVTCTGWSDPRAEGSGKPQEGEVNICPERFPPHIVKAMKLALRIDAQAQLQQDPKPGEGGIFDITKFADRIVKATPRRGRRVRYWDRAFGENEDGAYTVGALVNVSGGEVFIEDVQRKRLSPAKRNRFMKLIAMRDAHLSGNTVTIYIEQEPAAGKESALIAVRYLSGYPVFLDPPKTNKVARAIPLASQVTAGNVYMKEASWNNEVLQEMEYFPHSQFKDIVDAVSGAYNKIELGKMTIIEGDMLVSGDPEEASSSVPMSNREIADLAEVSPEIADIISGINRSSDTSNLDYTDADQNHPMFAAFSADVYKPDRVDDVLNRLQSEDEVVEPDAGIDNIEQEIADLLGGSEQIGDDEFKPTQDYTDDSVEPWPWEKHDG